MAISKVNILGTIYDIDGGSGSGSGSGLVGYSGGSILKDGVPITNTSLDALAFLKSDGT